MTPSLHSAPLQSWGVFEQVALKARMLICVLVISDIESSVAILTIWDQVAGDVITSDIKVKPVEHVGAQIAHISMLVMLIATMVNTWPGIWFKGFVVSSYIFSSAWQGQQKKTYPFNLWSVCYQSEVWLNMLDRWSWIYVSRPVEMKESVSVRSVVQPSNNL